jgi:hypothetical protein
MRKTLSLALAAAFILGVALVAAPAQAVDWCDMCAQDPQNCWACCRCSGGGPFVCVEVCGAPDSADDLEAWTADEPLACTSDDASEEARDSDEPAVEPSE